MLNDIDDEKQRLHDLARAREEADSRGRAKDTFLANMSHEIRTPMHAMLGFTRILDSSGLDENQRECVDAILSSGDLLLELLNDLLDLSRIEAGAIELDPAVANIRDSVRQTLALFQSRAEQKKIDLNLHIDADVPERVEFDRLRVHQVVSNLISNAVKFTDHGTVELALRARPANSNSSGEGWRITIEVSDTGIGIEQEQVDRLFNPFVQADSSISRKFGGTGLGLAISQRLCELMGGTINVTSKPGLGSTFTAVFSARAADRATTNAPLAKPTKTVGDPAKSETKVLRVLVVEDNRLNRRLAGMMLQKLGHNAVFAEHGVEALARLEREDFDLILMDLQMPELDGFETTQEIRRRETAAGPTDRKPVPIIALTANAETEEKRRCLVAGMDDFLTKPLDMAKFRDSLSRIHR